MSKPVVSERTYPEMPVEELLSAMERAGRGPDPALIRAILGRDQEISTWLLQMLQAEPGQEWEDDDPRWYRNIHAGLLLCSLREPAALPIFAQILRDPDWEDSFDWFDTALPLSYGPLAVPMLIDLASDVGASLRARIAAADMLSVVGTHHPDMRERIARAMGALLPQLDQDGRPILTPEERDDPPELWTWAVSALMEIRDLDSQPRVIPLFGEDVIDDNVFGDLEDYLAVFKPDAEPPVYAHYSFDILETYEGLHQEAQEEGQRKAREAKLGLVGRPAGERAKIGRNDPCPCGSGKKYKKCCGQRR